MNTNNKTHREETMTLNRKYKKGFNPKNAVGIKG